MLEVLFSFLILALAVAGMALGVMRGRKPIQGSCGGLDAIGLSGECEICGGDPSRCDPQRQDPR